ncbi:hypothetical protein BH10ACT1_BH10ACT1_25330 [soil metagenome]
MAVQGLVVLGGLTSIVQVIVASDRIDLLDRVLRGDPNVTLQGLRDSDDLWFGVNRIGSILYVLTLIVFLFWLRRVFQNLHGALKVNNLDYSTGWAVGWWFVPFANFFKPKQVMNEAWTASEPTHGPYSSTWARDKAPALLSWWWASFLLANFSVRLGFTSDDSTLKGVRQLAVYGRVQEVLHLVLCVLFVLVVRGITGRQEQRAVSLATRDAWPG